MESLGDLVKKMDSQMDRADSKLDFLSTRLDQFETKVLLPDADEEQLSVGENRKVDSGDKAEGSHRNGQDTSAKEDYDDNGLDPKLLTELLMDVRHVKQEYDHLLQNVHQVQELQQEVTRSLRKEMKQVQSHFDRLRERVIGSNGGGVPSNK